MMIVWVLQGLLAVAFLGAGSMKLLKRKEDLLSRGEKMAWVEEFSPGSLRAIGGVEVLGAIGLVAPVATGILPILTPIAAAGLVLTMLGAAATHVRRGEYGAIAPNAVLAGMAMAVFFLRV